jgi:hypothetical protein
MANSYCSIDSEREESQVADPKEVDSDWTDSNPSDDANYTRSQQFEAHEQIPAANELSLFESKTMFQAELERPLATSIHPTEGSTSARIVDAPFTLLSPIFTGMQDQLKRVEDVLTQRKVERGATCAITGRAEVGKTQLSLKFASELSTSVNLFWLSAASTDTFARGLENLLVLLQGDEKLVSFNHKHRLRAARQALETFGQEGDREWLLIVDDVDGSSLNLLRECLPSTGRSGSIIFTTRSHEAARLLVGRPDAIVQLNPPSTDLAAEIFLNNLGKPRALTSSEDVRVAIQIAELVDCMPLALEQAATVLKKIQFSNLAAELRTIHEQPEYKVMFGIHLCGRPWLTSVLVGVNFKNLRTVAAAAEGGFDTCLESFAAARILPYGQYSTRSFLFESRSPV